MELFSLLYIIFVAALLLLYYGLPHIRKSWSRFQWWILLAGSLAFYLYEGKSHIVFLLGTSLTTYAGGLAMSALDAGYAREKKQIKDRAQRKKRKAVTQRKKRVVLTAVLVFNFGILAWLKYWNVLFQSGSLVLPLGISFYTFQAVSYLIDLYGSKYAPEKNYAKFLLFVSWFPQMLQGPIGRYDRLSVCLFSEHRFDGERAQRALYLILFGLLKKYAVADMLEAPIASIFDSGSMADRSGSMVVFGILLYSVWQYADFSGGIDIVRGVSELFGVTLDENFRQPYFSTSLGDFWRRWHITLGAWMRDYVFYPFALTKGMQNLGRWCTKHLGKHAGRTIPAGIANIVVFLLVGIWHGAQSHYVLWGLYNGVVIALSDLTAPLWQNLAGKLHMNTESKGFHVFRVIRTFLIVNIGWYFDRIYDFHDCMLAFYKTFADFRLGDFGYLFENIVVAGAGSLANVLGSFAVAAAGTVLMIVISVKKERGQDPAGELAAKGPVPAGIYAWFCLTLIFVSFIYTTSAGGFLYANF